MDLTSLKTADFNNKNPSRFLMYTIASHLAGFMHTFECNI